ncbi:phosphotransferase [Paenibacillus gansuensis]|uniref:Phosphotransferase n=1 Tax=Paenibacillus gansuensis TaxID=306542 RepID=A0ABW5PB69_9BACL
MGDRESIIRTCRRMRIERKLSAYFHKRVTLAEGDIRCLKDTQKSQVWRLGIRKDGKAGYIVLKIIKPLPFTREKSLVEINMYRKAKPVLNRFMPDVYYTESLVNGGEFWAFMQYVRPTSKRKRISIHELETVMKNLAQFHSLTYNRRFSRHRRRFEGWLPFHYSSDQKQLRLVTMQKTLAYLDQAMQRPDLHSILAPHYSFLEGQLRKGPDFFRRLKRAGQSVVHQDLISLNISFTGSSSQQVAFIDWESAKFAPCWFDVVHAVRMYIMEHPEWENREAQLAERCARTYARAMKRLGIRFGSPAVTLYKMASVQMILQHYLYLFLRRAMKGRQPAPDLVRDLQKLNIWGQQLGLH